MQALDPDGIYTDAEVIDALAGRHGSRELTFRYDRLDEQNKLIEPIETMLGGSIAQNSLADIKRTARFSLLDRTGINFLKDRIRPWCRLTMPALPGDERRGYVQWPLGIFLLSTPTRQASPEGVVTREVLAYDQLVVLRDDKVDTRYSVAAGTAFTTAIATLVAGTSVVSASVVPSALTTTTVREWEPGTSKLRILNDLLDAINYGSAWFDEAGTLICRPYQSPADRAVEWTYSDTDGARLRTGSAEQELDLFDVPNRWVLIKGEPDEAPLVATYTNANPASATSTLSRGRTIVDFRTEQDAADQATLNAKAARLAFESSQVFERVVIETPIMPIHSDSDVLRLRIPSLAMDAKYGEQSWAMPLRVGGRMTHTVRRVVTI